MKDTDYDNLIHLANVGGGFIPANEKAEELLLMTRKGEVIELTEVTKRDLKLHRCYMSLLSFIYDYLPVNFHSKVDKKNFYKWLKHLRGQYKVLYTFADGTSFVEYESISFGRMSNIRFKEYVLEQMPFIYENVIGAFFEEEMYDNIIETIEEEYKKFFSKLV